mgnify:CR=1 FL=1
MEVSNSCSSRISRAFLILRLTTQNPNASVWLSCRKTGSATTVGEKTRRSYVAAGGYAYDVTLVPIDTTIKFDMYREGGAATGMIEARLIGWI